MCTVREVTMKKNKKVKILFLSFYDLDYGIGAAASFIDMLMDLPPNSFAIILEPIRIDLPRRKIGLPHNVIRIKVPTPFTRYLSVIYPFFAFFYCLKIFPRFKPDIIVSMHHPFHILSLVANVIAKIFRVPHVINLEDTWRPMGNRISLLSYLSEALERISIRLINMTYKNNLFVFVCSELKQLLEARIGEKIKHSLILPNCVPYTLLKKLKAKSTPRSPKIIRFIFVGNISPGYQLHKIFPILDELYLRGYRPILVVAGHLRVNLPSKYVKYVGNLSRIETLKLIAESDVGVGPLGPTLTVPKKVVEYLALGKIVIVGKRAISRDILREFQNYIIEISDDDRPQKIVLELLRRLNKKGERFYSGACDKERAFSKLYCKNRLREIIKELSDL